MVWCERGRQTRVMQDGDGVRLQGGQDVSPRGQGQLREARLSQMTIGTVRGGGLVMKD